jgi:hypothetical protein
MLHLMLWLASHSDEYLARLDIKRSASELGWSRSRVIRAVAELEELGLISTEQVPYGQGTRTRFTLHLDEWSDPDRVSKRDTPDVPKRDTPDVPKRDTPVYRNETPSKSTCNLEEHVECSSSALTGRLASDRFDEFWTIYGNLAGTGKKKARECWTIAMKRGDPPDDIIEGLKAWVTYWRTPGANKAMYAQGFLNQQKWATPPPPVPTEYRRAPGMQTVINGLRQSDPLALIERTTP